MRIQPSSAIAVFDDQYRTEYEDLLNRTKREIAAVEGTETMHAMLLERFCFTYVALRSMESEWTKFDIGRYNQLLGIWIKITKELLSAYKEMMLKGALSDIFISKVMMIVTEECTDPEQLARIRKRLETARREEIEATATV